MTRIHLVRHGEVDNPEGILYGRLPNFGLTERGHEMARRVGEHFAAAAVSPDELVCSPLLRAQQTITPLRERLNMSVFTDDRVIEAANDFEGLTVGKDPKQLLRPRLWPKLINPLQPSWGEPYEEIAARMRAAVDTARANAEGHEAVIVSHQLPVWTARQSYEGKRLWHDPRKRECALASVTSLTFNGTALSFDLTATAAGVALDNISAVPEPSSLALLLGGATLLLARRRRG